MKGNLLNFSIFNIELIRIVDVLLVCLLVYILYKSIEGSTAVKIASGFFCVYLFYLLVEVSKLKLMKFLLKKLIKVGPIIPIVVFQKEIRRFLFNLGKIFVSSKEVMVNMLPWLYIKKAEVDVTPVVKAIQALGGSNTGALIVFTKDADLRYYEDSGDLINAVVSARLLIAIFNKYSPLHDGAVIIHNNRIVAARCILPVSDNSNIPARFGLRHKAAVGLTEVTDTLVLIVSEESGQISIARQGKMENNFSIQEVRSILKDYLK